MYNKVMIAAYFLMSSNIIQTMYNPATPQGPRDPNIALILATVSGPLDKAALADIDFLFQVGADPHFISPWYKITPLMRAVRANEPELVQLLLQKGAKVNVANSYNKFVRDFNIIYRKKEIARIIGNIVTYMLEIETHNIMNFNEYIDCREELNKLTTVNSLRKALLIDKTLEDHRAYSDYSDVKHPLLIFLRDSRVTRALTHIIDDNFQNVPSAIRNITTGKLQS